MTRYNSTIKVKCKCRECSKDPDNAKVPTMSCYGYFYGHLPEDLKEKAGTKSKVAVKNRNKRVALGRKLHIAQKAADKKTEGTPAWKVELFFAAAAIELAKNPFCLECKAFISEFYYRASIAHILPKKEEYGFPSVAAHPKNRLFLGAECGCHNKTHRWDTFSKMKVWPQAVEAFKEIYPYIFLGELKNLPDILLKELIS